MQDHAFLMYAEEFIEIKPKNDFLAHSKFYIYTLLHPISYASSLGQFLATESPLKMVKNAFYFTSKALFVLKLFKFLSLLFGHVAKRLD